MQTFNEAPVKTNTWESTLAQLPDLDPQVAAALADALINRQEGESILELVRPYLDQMPGDTAHMLMSMLHAQFSDSITLYGSNDTGTEIQAMISELINGESKAIVLARPYGEHTSWYIAGDNFPQA